MTHPPLHVSFCHAFKSTIPRLALSFFSVSGSRVYKPPWATPITPPHQKDILPRRDRKFRVSHIMWVFPSAPSWKRRLRALQNTRLPGPCLFSSCRHERWKRLAWLFLCLWVAHINHPRLLTSSFLLTLKSQSMTKTASSLVHVLPHRRTKNNYVEWYESFCKAPLGNGDAECKSRV